MAAPRRPKAEKAEKAEAATSSDPLALYNKKRRFNVTPEPPGDLAPARAAGLSFVIQKHAASRLHYDFRLEIDGLLKSWSVPKGPSLDPAQKRLAVETENHPLAYGGFEGIIPEGEYGGGTVLVWDNGTWEPVDDLAKSLASGHLKFVLRGHKLQGKYALVRLKGNNPYGQDGRSWLLVKDRDAFARPESAGLITEEEPFSVLSGRDLEEIAQKKERVWHSVRGRPDVAKLAGAREGEMPEQAPAWTAEQHAHGGPKRQPNGRANNQANGQAKGRVKGHASGPVPSGDEWLHERMVRGAQVHICLDNGRISFFRRGARGDEAARRGNVGVTNWWSTPLAEALASLPVREGWWEGVVTALGAEGGTADVPAHARELGSHATLALFVTDLAYLDGSDLTMVPYEERKGMATALLGLARDEVKRQVRTIDHVVGRGPEVWQAARQLGFEGLVSKRRDFHRGAVGAVLVTSSFTSSVTSP